MEVKKINIFNNLFFKLKSKIKRNGSLNAIEADVMFLFEAIPFKNPLAIENSNSVALITSK